MKDSTLVSLGRMACGTALLITHAVTGYNGVMLSCGLFLLGIPFERAFIAKEKEAS